MKPRKEHCPNCESRALIHADDLLPRLDQPKMRVCLDCGSLVVLIEAAEHEYWIKRMTAEGRFGFTRDEYIDGLPRDTTG